MDVIGWLLVIYSSQGYGLVLPTEYPSESVCIMSAKAAYMQPPHDVARHGLTAFICIPGHSPLHGGKEG